MLGSGANGETSSDTAEYAREHDTFGVEYAAEHLDKAWDL